MRRGNRRERIAACLRHNRLEFEMRVEKGKGELDPSAVQPPTLPNSRNGGREIAKDQMLTEASQYPIQLA
jgi:hypothetical protein